MTLPSNPTNFRACKPSIHFYSTIYRSGEKTGGLGGCPPGNAFYYSTIYSPRSDPSKTDGGSKGCPLEMPPSKDKTIRHGWTQEGEA
jgi:hypothetical protein